MSSEPAIDWARLRHHAGKVATMAYAPYSRLCVGAAGLIEGDVLVTGCNVENASFGLTLCAECGLVSDLYRSGGNKLYAISIVSSTGDMLLPCGRCRQLLSEVGGPDLLVDTPRGAARLEVLLPSPFGVECLPAIAEA